MSDNKNLKGKDTFTSEEIKTLRSLIKQRVKAVGKKEQKPIRDKMRKIGFYGRDRFEIIDLTLEDFENLIELGKVKIKD